MAYQLGYCDIKFLHFCYMGELNKKILKNKAAKEAVLRISL